MSHTMAAVQNKKTIYLLTFEVGGYCILTFRSSEHKQWTQCDCSLTALHYYFVKKRYQEVVCSASDHQGSNFELCVRRAVASHSSHNRPSEVLLARFSRHVPKGGLNPHSFPLIYFLHCDISSIDCLHTFDQLYLGPNAIAKSPYLFFMI